VNKPVPAPSFAVLLQRFFTEHLQQHRAVSPRTIVAYRDTFRLLLAYAEKALGREPQHFLLADLNAKFILAFLDYLETERKNSVRSRNARLAALRSFLKYAAHHDLSELDCIQHAALCPNFSRGKRSRVFSMLLTPTLGAVNGIGLSSPLSTTPALASRKCFALRSGT